MLQNAATLEVTQNVTLMQVTVKVINQSGHKLPSGYPEGRRMWLNLKAYDAQMNQIAEFGAYDTATAVLTTSNTKVYEVKLGMSPEILTATGLSNDPDGSSFHFVLNNKVVKDNRIPPRGFTNANFKQIQSPPVDATYADGQFWDETTFTLPSNALWYEVNLYYQTASKEYITFLRDNNTTNDWGTRLYSAWSSSGKSRPVLMTRFVSSTPLPVQLASFVGSVANQNNVLLEWTTVSEVNNYGFFVQRRADGQMMFEELPDNFVPGQGTTLIPQHYSWQQEQVAAGSYEYRLRQVDLDGTQHFTHAIPIVVLAPTNIRSSAEIPRSFALYQNHPNPFNPQTTINFDVSERTDVSLVIYSLSGQEVANLLNRNHEVGRYSVSWNSKDADGQNVASGVYLCRLHAGSVVRTVKMVVIR